MSCSKRTSPSWHRWTRLVRRWSEHASRAGVALAVAAIVFWSGLALEADAAPIEGPVAAPRLHADLVDSRDAAALTYGFHSPTTPSVGLPDRAATAAAFPMLLVDWQPTERLSITAGRQLCTSAGPGAHAIYALAEHLDLTLGFRFERKRFRLAPQPGLDPNGTGVEQRAPAFATLRLGPPNAFVALVAGAELRGKLRIEDERGGVIAERLERPSPFVGLAGRLTF